MHNSVSGDAVWNNGRRTPYIIPIRHKALHVRYHSIKATPIFQESKSPTVSKIPHDVECVIQDPLGKVRSLPICIPFICKIPTKLMQKNGDGLIDNRFVRCSRARSENPIDRFPNLVMPFVVRA